MRRVRSVALLSLPLLALMSSTHSAARAPVAPRTIDFARDVQPIFQQRCYECHGPDSQMNGFRLDRRHDAMRGGTMAVIGPGSAASSRLYLRLVGSAFGRRMPLETEPLPPDDIETIRLWIDQGATWPDAVSGDVSAKPLDPVAVRAFDALRRGDRRQFLAALQDNDALSTLRGPGGATPLMAAALYGDAPLVKLLLDRGARPDVANDAGATPLMWAVTDLEKTRLLVERGADVNARSNDGRVPLLIAAGIRGNRAVLELLLDHGAKPSAQSPGIGAPMTAITEAAKQGDEAEVRLLIERGSDVARAGFPAIAWALRAQCEGCVEAIAAKMPPPLFTPAMAFAAPPQGAAVAMPTLLAHGADARARNPQGYPMLVLAAASEAMPLDAVTALLAHGADVNATGPNGETALMVARRHGQTPIVDALLTAGATDVPVTPGPVPAFAPAASPRDAVTRSIPLLQQAGEVFMQRSGCVSCHHNTQTLETIALARSRRIPFDDAIVARDRVKVAAYLEEWHERNLLGQGIPGDTSTMSSVLNALATEHPLDPGLTTDAVARFVRLQQTEDGSWRAFGHRPPIGAGEVRLTLDALRVVRAFTPPTERALGDASVARASAWLARVQPTSLQDQTFKVLGLRETGAAREVIASAARVVTAQQRQDGGWAQLPTLGSDAYATGQVLFTLLKSGAVTAADPTVKRGVQFLLNTQLADGSWHVGRRAIPLQPYFDAGFPHGADQFISASATNWAAQALLLTIDAPRSTRTRSQRASR